MRHAKAEKRSRWESPDELRPLNALGHRQAQGLVGLLDGVRIDRLVTSPYLRCRQTLEPLAADRSLPLAREPRLGEGQGVRGAIAVIDDLGEGSIVVCSHGDLIPAMLTSLAERGVEIHGERTCDKGALWAVEWKGRGGRAVYLPPHEKRSRQKLPSGFLDDDSGDAAPDEHDVESVRLGVLDLGSTSFHLVVVDVAPSGAMQRVMRERIMLRLGAVTGGGRRVPDDVAKTAVETARALRKVAEEAEVEHLVPVATAAFRDAANGPAIARRIGRALGEPVRVLEGEEEARLIFAAFRRRVALGTADALGVDLGGGSLELAIGSVDDVAWETTLPLGAARLHGELVSSDPIGTDEVAAIRGRVAEGLAPHRDRVRRWRLSDTVATGGTIGALARLVAAQRGRDPVGSINELWIPRAELAALAERLAASTHDERLEMPGIRRRRADLLPVGALVLDAAAERLGLEGFTVSDWGLREGVALEYLGLAGRLDPGGSGGPPRRRTRRSRRTRD